MGSPVLSSIFLETHLLLWTDLLCHTTNKCWKDLFDDMDTNTIMTSFFIVGKFQDYFGDLLYRDLWYSECSIGTETSKTNDRSFESSYSSL